MLLISRKVLQQTKQPINLKYFLPAPTKTSPKSLTAKNYQVLRQTQQEGDLLNKTSISSVLAVNSHVSFSV